MDSIVEHWLAAFFELDEMEAGIRDHVLQRFENRLAVLEPTSALRVCMDCLKVILLVERRRPSVDTAPARDMLVRAARRVAIAEGRTPHAWDSARTRFRRFEDRRPDSTSQRLGDSASGWRWRSSASLRENPPDWTNQERQRLLARSKLEKNLERLSSLDGLAQASEPPAPNRPGARLGSATPAPGTDLGLLHGPFGRGHWTAQAARSRSSGST